MSSSLPNFLETGINVFNSNSQIMKNTKYYEISTIYECVEKWSMTIVCNIWMICLELNCFVYDPSWMLHLCEFVWTLCLFEWVDFKSEIKLPGKAGFQAISFIIYILCLSGCLIVFCLSVCRRLYSINIKLVEPIGPEYCVRPQMTTEKVYGCSKLQKWSPKVLDFL